MLPPFRAVVVGLAAVTACGTAGGDSGVAGRVVIERAGRTIVDARARGSRCAADSTVAVAVTTAAWAGAFAARLPWPVDSTQEVPVGQILGPGTAVVAVRPLTDSIGNALISARGVLTLEPADALTGRFDVMAPILPGGPDSVRLTGRFTGVPVTDDLCPVPGGP